MIGLAGEQKRHVFIYIGRIISYKGGGNEISFSLAICFKYVEAAGKL